MSPRLRAPTWCLLTTLAAGACGSSAGDPGGPGAPDAGMSGRPVDAAVAAPTLTDAVGYLAVTTRLTVAGTFAAPPTIDLGPDVLVDGIDPIAAGRVTAAVTVAPTAALGARDVTITDGTQRWTLPGAFVIEPSLSATVIGSPSQGALVDLELASLRYDVDLWTSPFHVGGDTLELPGEQSNVRGLFLIAPGAAPGPRHLEWRLVPQGPAHLATGPGALTIAARAPVDLAPGVHATGPMQPLETALRRVALDEDAIYVITAAGVDLPHVWLFDGAGRAADRVAYRSASEDLRRLPPTVLVELPGRGAALTMVAHNSHAGIASHSIDLGLEVIPATHVAQQPGHATIETAQDASACGTACVLTGELAPGQRHVIVVPAGSRVDPPLPAFAALSVAIVGDTAASVTELDAGGGTGRHLTGSVQRQIWPRRVLSDTTGQARYFAITGNGDAPERYRVSIRSLAWQ